MVEPLVLRGVKADILHQLVLPKYLDEQVRNQPRLQNIIDHGVYDLDASNVLLRFLFEFSVSGEPTSHHCLNFYDIFQAELGQSLLFESFKSVEVPILNVS